MENGPFIDDFHIKTSIYKGFSMAMLVITRWYPLEMVDFPVRKLLVYQAGSPS